MQEKGLKRELGLWSAILVVVASMIGSGIFGNTGIIQKEVGSPILVMILWFLGGAIALSGALSYAELATMMPHAGGEYVYLKKSFGLLPSFLTGWVSFMVAFSAPAASSSLLSATYALEFIRIVAPQTSIHYFFESEWNQKLYAIVLIAIFSIFHMTGVKKGGAVQNILSFFKLVLVFIFAIAGLAVALGTDHGVPVAEAFQSRPVQWSGFGVGLLFVMFAYSGWNGATYLAEEIKEPNKNLPRALFLGTLIITLLYLLLNLLYYLSTPLASLSGETAVAALAASHLFGNNVTLFFNISFSIFLLSSISVSIMLGPRVLYAMSRDNLFFKKVASLDSKSGTPVVAIALQGGLSILYILTGKYEDIQAYMNFALSIFPVLTVVGLIVLRREHPDMPRPYRTPLYPFLPIFFAVFSVVIMITSFMGRPVHSMVALGVVFSGIPFFYIWRFIYVRKLSRSAADTTSTPSP